MVAVLRAGASNGRLFYWAALLLLACAWVGIRFDATMLVHDTLFVVDVSESMNVQDADPSRPTLARIELAKSATRDAMAALGCGSRVSLGLFSGDDVVVLFEPLEVCEHFSAMEQVVDRLGTRARWIGDSRLERGLLAAIREAASRRLNVVFVSDGDEMPHRGAPRVTELERVRGKARGAVLVVGGDTPLPVPRLDDRDEVVGYWTPQEAARQGYYPNHTAAVTALEEHDAASAEDLSDVTEHLSAARPDYLKALGTAAGLTVAQIRTGNEAIAPARARNLGRDTVVRADAGWIFCALAALAALAAWFAPVAIGRGLGRRAAASQVGSARAETEHSGITPG